MEILDPLGVCKKEVLNSLREISKKLGYEGVQLELETPPENLGDISLSCFSLAKVAKKAPEVIATEISEQLAPMETIERWENVGAYVNFHINPTKLSEMTLKAVLVLKDEYGDSPPRNKKIVLEHTSANPTDKLHIGRARNPIIGDTLARILRKAGYEIETQYYVDDMGKQAVTLSYGIKMWDSRPSDDDSLGPYQWGSKLATTSYGLEAIKDMLQRLEDGHTETIEEVVKDTRMVMDEDIISTLAKINVHVDRYVSESRFVQDGSVDRVIEALKKSEYCSEEEGAFNIDLEQFGVKGGVKRFFFTRSDGTSLYATRDIAYHLWKFEHCDDVINILGEDHKLEAEQVRIGLEILSAEKAPEIIFYSFVTLPEGRMSTRKATRSEDGKVKGIVFMDDLLDEAVERAEIEVKKRRSDISDDRVRKIAEIVGIGAVRYNLVNVQPEKKIVFRWEDALNFEGDSAPFIQYAHARACSISRKAKEQGVERYDDYDPTLLEHISEITLIKEMAKFPETVRECAEGRKPHAMASYAFGLASLFNQFYRDCPVLGCENDSLRKARLALVDSAKIVLKNSLFCLGIEAPDEM